MYTTRNSPFLGPLPDETWRFYQYSQQNGVSVGSSGSLMELGNLVPNPRLAFKMSFGPGLTWSGSSPPCPVPSISEGGRGSRVWLHHSGKAPGSSPGKGVKNSREGCRERYRTVVFEATLKFKPCQGYTRPRTWGWASGSHCPQCLK